jgi:hypothetical protein
MSTMHPTLRIEFDEGDRDLVIAGQPLRGRLLIDSPSPLPISGVELTLGWRTSGRGDSDHREVQSLRLLGDGTLEGSRACPFTLDVPAAPLSHPGRLVRIGWWIEGTVRRSRAANIQQRWPIHVA